MSFTLRQREVLVEAYKDRGWLPFGTHRGTRNGLMDRGLFAWDHDECHYLLTPEGWEEARVLAAKEARQ